MNNREAFQKGKRSWNSLSDWDDALARFSRKYCDPHSPTTMCALEHAWCDGWDSNN